MSLLAIAVLQQQLLVLSIPVAAAGLANDDLCIEDDLAVGTAWIVYPLDQEFCRGSSDLVGGLLNYGN